MTPEPPYFVFRRKHAPSLELASDGSQDACRAFVQTLQGCFGARVTEVRDGGTIPDDLYPLPYDKEKGYYFLQIDGQEFLLMRDRGCGMCLWGPKPPESPATFLEIARYVGAVERRTPIQQVLAWFGRTGRRA